MAFTVDETGAVTSARPIAAGRAGRSERERARHVDRLGAVVGREHPALDHRLDALAELVGPGCVLQDADTGDRSSRQHGEADVHLSAQRLIGRQDLGRGAMVVVDFYHGHPVWQRWQRRAFTGKTAPDLRQVKFYGIRAVFLCCKGSKGRTKQRQARGQNEQRVCVQAVAAP